MRRKSGLIAMMCLLAFGMAAQQPQQQNSSGQNAQNMGTVRNDRTGTVPQIGVSAQANEQNELVGCLARNGKDLVLNQREQRRTYQLRGDESQLEQNVGKLVKLTGRLLMGNVSAFQVQQVQPVQDTCHYEDTSGGLPATGKAGNAGRADNVTSTKTAGQVTPGVQTAHGAQQNPSTTEDPQAYGANPRPGPRPTASQGAPPAARSQSPMEAQRIADAARQAELSNQKKLGVNAQPNYSTANNGRQNERAVANAAQQERGQATQSKQVLKGGQQATTRQNTQSSQQPSGSAPTFTGCLTQSGKEIWLTEQGSNERIQVEGDQGKLKEHLNHLVQIVGNKSGTYGPAVGTSGNTVTVHVQAIQDLAPTCSK